MKKIQISFFLALAFFATACGGGELTVKDAWARPALAGNNGAIYFVIQNPGADDTLLSVATDAAEIAEMHMTMMVEDGTMEHGMDQNMSGSDTGTMPEAQVMRMVKQENVPVPGRGKVEFAPGGLHVMLIGLKSDLVVGDNIEVTFTFENAGEITLQVPVKEQ